MATDWAFVDGGGRSLELLVDGAELLVAIRLHGRELGRIKLDRPQVRALLSTVVDGLLRLEGAPPLDDASGLPYLGPLE